MAFPPKTGTEAEDMPFRVGVVMMGAKGIDVDVKVMLASRHDTADIGSKV